MELDAANSGFQKFYYTMGKGCLCLLLSTLLAGCGLGSFVEEDILEPDVSARSMFLLFPGQTEAGDSALRTLAKGAQFSLQGRGNYELRMRYSGMSQLPVLRLFRIIPGKENERFLGPQLLMIEPIDSADWVIYPFESPADGHMDVITVLDDDGQFATGHVEKAQLHGHGNFGHNLEINLIFAGHTPAFADSTSRILLGETLLTTLRRIFESAEIVFPTLRLLRAEDNPDHGSAWPPQQMVLYPFGDFRADSLSDWPDRNIARGLDFILVDRFDTEGILGQSPVYGDFLTSGRRSTIVLAARFSKSGFLLESTPQDIATTAAHELGHFLGLRHTTLTALDRHVIGDYSQQNDGLEDTPWCRGLDMLLAHQPGSVLARYAWSGGDYCPDASNLMFPTITPNYPQEFLSPQQIAIIRNNLSLYPR